MSLFARTYAHAPHGCPLALLHSRGIQFCETAKVEALLDNLLNGAKSYCRFSILCDSTKTPLMFRF